MLNKIPTNIITGFLGVGKTTAIKQLLKQKPANEVWGILVNEFGEIGIDGTILSAFGQSLPDQVNHAKNNVIIKEVSGGCLCCVAGLPMKVGLNLLIKAKPDRILIEPTGLGHLQEVINDLSGEFYRKVLDLNATICLVDPAHIDNRKYIENSYFQDQISLADVLIANKTERLDDDNKADFMRFSEQLIPCKASLQWTQQGYFSIETLALPIDPSRKSSHLALHLKHSLQHQAVTQYPVDPRFKRQHSQREGLFSYGWAFNEQQLFDRNALTAFLTSLTVTRLKAVIKTDQGSFLINSVAGAIEKRADFQPISTTTNSKIEIISMIELSAIELEKSLCDCLVF